MVFLAKPSLCYGGVWRRKCPFLGIRTFAAREKPTPTPLFHFPGRLGSPRVALAASRSLCGFARGHPRPRPGEHHPPPEAEHERRRGSGDARSDVTSFLIGIARAARLRMFFFRFSASRAFSEKCKKGPFRNALFTPTTVPRTLGEERVRRKKHARAGRLAAFVFPFSAFMARTIGFSARQPVFHFFPDAREKEEIETV